MNPIVVTFNSNAGDTGFLEWLQDFYGASKGEGKDLASVEQVASNQNEIDLLPDCGDNDVAKHAEEVFVTYGFTGRGAVGFAEVDIGGVNKANNHGRPLRKTEDLC